MIKMSHMRTSVPCEAHRTRSISHHLMIHCIHHGHNQELSPAKKANRFMPCVHVGTDKEKVIVNKAMKPLVRSGRFQKHLECL